MFNLSGSEIVFLLIIALVVLGPEKLPDAVRRFGKFYGEFKRMSTGFQSEFRSAFEEPMREMRETSDALRKAANLDFEPTRVDGDTGAVATETTPIEPVEATPAIETVPAVDAAPAADLAPTDILPAETARPADVVDAAPAPAEPADDETPGAPSA